MINPVPKRRIFRSPEQLARVPKENYRIVEDKTAIKIARAWYKQMLSRRENDRERAQIIENQWFPSDKRTILVEMDAY